MDSLDCVPRGAGKAWALRQLAQAVSADTVVAVGDGLNDLPMFAVANLSICLGGNPQVQAAATASFPEIGPALEYLAEVLREI